MFEALYETNNSRFPSDFPYNPKPFEHGKEQLVAKLKGAGDGQNVEVYETRLPARFYTIKALPTPNSIGKTNAGFSLSTGSGCEQLVYDIAKAISEGMLALD